MSDRASTRARRTTDGRAGRQLERAAVWSLVGWGLTAAGGTFAGQFGPHSTVSGLATDPFVVGCVVLTLVGVVGFARTGAGVGASTILALGPVSGLAVVEVGWTVAPRLALLALGVTVVAAASLGGVGVAAARITGASWAEHTR